VAPVRLVASISALAAGIAAVAIAAVRLQDTPGPSSSSAAAPFAIASPAPRGRSAPPQPAFPAPPPGAVVLAREDGPYALAVAVLPGRAQVSVVGQQGRGVSGLPVTIDGVHATSCGPGCYEAAARAPIDVRIASTTWRPGVRATAPGASRLVARAGRAWRALTSLAFSDRLGSDLTHVVLSSWRAVAPDRIEYHVQGGSDGIVIGDRRWDRDPGGTWIESAQTVRLRQPVPLWQSATDAHVLADTGRAWRISFYDPHTPGWFEITVEKRTFHTLDLRMTTTAHFMHERYRSFDAAAPITSP